MKHLKKLLIKTCILILLLIKINHSHAQITNFGTDFWFGFTEVYDTSLTTGASYVVYISSLVNTTGNISIPGQGFSQNFSVSPGIISSITLPPAMVRVITSEILENKAIHITTNDNVAVYAHTYHLHRSEASLILPVTTLGSDYYVSSYNPSGTFPSEFLIIGSGVPVTVEITPTANTIGGNLANVPFNVTINPNQVFQVQSIAGDLTGSRVRALNPVDKFSVIGGGKFPAVPTPPGTGTKDPIYEQLFPVSTWGKNYIFIPTPLLNDDICRIMASQNGTIININGTQVATLNAGQFYEQSIINPSSISANLPISVARYLKCGNCVANPITSPSNIQKMSDPAMVIINANEQMYLDTITFYASPNFEIDTNYVQVITRTADVNTIFLDGNNMGANFLVIATNPFYSYMNMPIDTGTHTLASNGCGFLAYITGLGGAESYAYAAGVSLRNISINSLAPDSACVGDNIQFSGSSFGSATTWNWNFGDGNTSNLQNPSHTYSSVGNYTVILVITTNNGCPDTLSQSIEITSCCPRFFTQSPTICSNDSIVINGNIYNTSGTFIDTIFNGASNGCDSIITTILTANPIATSTDIQIACDSLTWIDGATYTISTSTPTDTLIAANGCDSIITLNLTIYSSTTGIDTQTACDSLTWLDGITYSASTSTPTYTITSGSTNGCDSVITLNLTINSTATFTQNPVICQSDSIVVNSNVYTTTGTFNDTIFNGAANGCDSIITTNLTVNPIATSTDIQIACDSLTWINGITYTISTNTPMDTLVAANGCDSIITLNLTINNSTIGIDIRTACDSLTWIDGITYSASTNTPKDTLIGTNGCDSIVTLNLTINSFASGIDAQTACDSLTWLDGITYNINTTTPTFTIIGGSASGCDSIITLNLTINNSTNGTDLQTTCDSLTWLDGITYTTSTTTPTFTIIGGAVNGCDSIITLNLTIKNSSIGTDIQTACDSLTWIDNITYTTSTNTPAFTIAGGASNGCDSIVTLNLTLSNTSAFTQTFTECQGFSVSVGTNTYNTSGNFIDTLTTLVGCDSIVTTNLTIITSSSITQNFVECEGFSVTVGTNTYTTTGIFTDVLNACDTVITDLTINPTPQITLVKADDNCGESIGSVAANVISANPPISYIWNTGSTDSIISNLPAGTYSIVITDSTGCSNLNSVEVLDLEIDCDFFVYVPNAFTPNGDGNNDVFFVNAKGVGSLSVKIYNRWGNKVFEINEVNDVWDGTYKGKKQNTAVFVYVLEATFLNGKTVTESGNVNLIR